MDDCPAVSCILMPSARIALRHFWGQLYADLLKSFVDQYFNVIRFHHLGHEESHRLPGGLFDVGLLFKEV
jgi:hypothetical protein